MRFVYLVLVFLYIISPYDLLPDFVAGLGWLDDIVLLILTLNYLSNSKKGSSFKSPPYDSYSYNADKEKSPFAVLGIEESSNSEKIKAAYRRLANQYHPDKVVHMDYEHYKMAEAKFREIKEAYEKLKDMA